MNYKKLNKAQLIERIEELEAQSITRRVTRFNEEARLLANDLLKSAKYIFNLGAETRRAVYSLSPIQIRSKNQHVC